MVARRLSAYCEAKGKLPEGQCGFRPDCSTTDMMFVVRRLQKIGRKAGVSLFTCFIDLQKAYKIVDRTLLWRVLNRIGISPQMIAVIRQFHDGMRACVRPDDEWFNDWGGGECRRFVPIWIGDGTKMAPPGDIFDQLPGEMNLLRVKLANHLEEHAVLSPERSV